MTPSLLTCIPFAPDYNLGRAYNEVMASLPDGGWACLLDHDVMFTTSVWHRQLLDAIGQYPQGTFVARTNRVGPDGARRGWQRVPDVSPLVHNLELHRAIGTRLAQDPTVRDVTEEPKLAAGFLFCVSKATWQAIGGFREGLTYVDWAFTVDLRAAGRRLYVIEGLYLYHWRRADGAPSVKVRPALSGWEYRNLRDTALRAQETA